MAHDEVLERDFIAWCQDVDLTGVVAIVLGVAVDIGGTSAHADGMTSWDNLRVETGVPAVMRTLSGVKALFAGH